MVSSVISSSLPPSTDSSSRSLHLSPDRSMTFSVTPFVAYAYVGCDSTGDPGVSPPAAPAVIAMPANGTIHSVTVRHLIISMTPPGYIGGRKNSIYSVSEQRDLPEQVSGLETPVCLRRIGERVFRGNRHTQFRRTDGPV